MYLIEDIRLSAVIIGLFIGLLPFAIGEIVMWWRHR